MQEQTFWSAIGASLVITFVFVGIGALLWLIAVRRLQGLQNRIIRCTRCKYILHVDDHSTHGVCPECGTHQDYMHHTPFDAATWVYVVLSIIMIALGALQCLRNTLQTLAYLLGGW